VRYQQRLALLADGHFPQPRLRVETQPFQAPEILLLVPVLMLQGFLRATQPTDFGSVAPLHQLHRSG
jgi:hypothetical protein